MKFLVDTQLPRHLAASLKWSGLDVLHTLDLPSGNRTPDWRINEISVAEHRIRVAINQLVAHISRPSQIIAVAMVLSVS